MRILVIGAGAVSGYFGARLVQHGRDVTFLVRARRADQLRAYGLRIAGANGDFTVRPRILDARELAASRTPFDLILLGVKAYSLGAAMDADIEAMHKDGKIAGYLKSFGLDPSGADTGEPRLIK